MILKTYRGASKQKWYEIGKDGEYSILIPEYNGGPYPSWNRVDSKTLEGFEYLGEEEPPEDVLSVATSLMSQIESGKKSRRGKDVTA